VCSISRTIGPMRSSGTSQSRCESSRARAGVLCGRSEREADIVGPTSLDQRGISLVRAEAVCQKRIPRAQRPPSFFLVATGLPSRDNRRHHVRGVRGLGSNGERCAQHAHLAEAAKGVARIKKTRSSFQLVEDAVGERATSS